MCKGAGTYLIDLIELYIYNLYLMYFLLEDLYKNEYLLCMQTKK